MGIDLPSDLGHSVAKRTFSLEKAVGTAEYAKHAKAERVGEEDRFTQRVNDLVSLTPFPLAYFAV